MREIKFRAWIESEHKMVEVDSIDFLHKNITYYDKEFQCILVASFDLIELMQYTGLKDINGTEIYEGDIIQGVVTNITVDDEWIEGYVGVVQYIDDGYYLRDKTDTIHISWLDEFEKIGNIIENPELVEV